MPSKDNPILSSHRDAASRVIEYMGKQHGITLKSTAALEVVARVLGAPNWQTLRAMGEQGRVPRAADQAHYDASAASASTDTPPMRNVEQAVQHVLLNLAGRKGLPMALKAPWEPLQSRFSKVEAAQGIYLSPTQAKGIEAASSNGLALLLGAPGTGLTTTARFWGAFITELGGQVYDAMGRAQMIAVLQAWKARNQEATTPEPCPVLLLDESALQDLPRLAELLLYIPYDCRVVMTIDQSSFKSDSGQRVLTALLDSAKPAIVRFSQVLRQSRVQSPLRYSPIGTPSGRSSS